MIWLIPVLILVVTCLIAWWAGRGNDYGKVESDMNFLFILFGIAVAILLSIVIGIISIL